MPPQPTTFTATTTCPWSITTLTPITGQTLPHATHLTLAPTTTPPAWSLRGITSNTRYTAEAHALAATQPASAAPKPPTPPSSPSANQPPGRPSPWTSAATSSKHSPTTSPSAAATSPPSPAASTTAAT